MNLLPGVLNWGLIGPGRIAHKFADALTAVPGARLAAVAGRDRARAQAFAQRWGGHVCSDAAELLADPRVDAVYIASSHAAHASAIEAALLAGKAVLCEKPLVTSAAEAERLASLARRQDTLLMEAMWTRFLPALVQAGQWLQAGEIGPLRSVQSSFCFPGPTDPSHRALDPAQAGGALLDVGVYCLSITRWALQLMGDRSIDELPQIQAQGRLGPTGVDERVHAQLRFGSGVVSQFVCAFDGHADNSFHILGERGCLVLDAGFWQCTRLRLVRRDEADRVVDLPWRHNGFEYQIEEAMRCMRAGLVESPGITHADTVATLRLIDALRLQLGVRYPFEVATGG